MAHCLTLGASDQPEAMEKAQRLFDSNIEVEMEVDYVSRSGRETPMLLRGARIACNGGQYLFGMGIDISKRRAREREMSSCACGAVGASAITRTIGSVPLGRTCTHRSGQVRRSPSCVSTTASGASGSQPYPSSHCGRSLDSAFEPASSTASVRSARQSPPSP